MSLCFADHDDMVWDSQNLTKCIIPKITKHLEPRYLFDSVLITTWWYMSQQT
jgi:hypothetical protein